MFGFSVKNIEVMVKFYRDVIGFNITWDGGCFAEAKTEGSMAFNLYERLSNDKLITPLTYPTGINGTAGISCWVEKPSDVDREYERLLAAGATPVYPPTTEPYGLRVCYIADPEGNVIEICAGINN
jgi:catechol 2,3-dioxygenase-like lactoylglutathione lyase family enzyme